LADQRRGEEVGSVLLELTVAEQRCNAVMEVLGDGLTVIEVAGRYGVSRQAVHGWLRRYRSGGLDALADRSHRPNTCPHQMPAAVEAACASCADSIPAGATAAWPTSWSWSASTHRPG
jgi:transposase-like protein